MTKTNQPNRIDSADIPLEVAARREFLLALGQLGFGAAALSLSPLTLNASQAEAIGLAHLDSEASIVAVQVARLLFPHQSLENEIYIQIARDIDSDISRRPQVNTWMESLPKLLDQQCDGQWLEMSLPVQIEALRKLEETETFFYLRNRTIESLYRNPAVWKLVGYEGSSIEHGGYLNRGFDDIDWLD